MSHDDHACFLAETTITGWLRAIPWVTAVVAQLVFVIVFFQERSIADHLLVIMVGAIFFVVGCFGARAIASRG